MTNEQLAVILKTHRLLLIKALEEVKENLPTHLIIKTPRMFLPNIIDEVCPSLHPIYNVVDLLDESIDALTEKERKFPGNI